MKNLHSNGAVEDDGLYRLAVAVENDPAVDEFRDWDATAGDGLRPSFRQGSPEPRLYGRRAKTIKPAPPDSQSR